MATVLFGDFEWDADKASVNLAKHGVSFEEAASVFLDLDLVITSDPIASERFIALGFSTMARLLFVVHLERSERVRIISARKASRAESLDYERRKQP